VLTETEYEVVCPVTFRHRGNSDRIASALAGNDAWHERVDVVICDLSAPIADTTASRFGRVDEIWNVASESHVDRSITEPVPFIENNVSLILNLLEYARREQPRLFIQMSTDEVYGPAAPGQCHQEWDRIAPSNPYSASKAAQEAVAFSYWRTFGVPVVITNTMNVIGETQDAEKMVPKTIRSLLLGEPAVVHVSPSGEPGSRFYLHARNLADAWLWISRHQTPCLYPESDVPLRYHVVGEREVTNTELVNFIADILGVEPRMKFINFHQSRPGHDLRYALDGQKLALDGWTAPVPFDDSLRRTVQWSVGHPKWIGLGREDMQRLQGGEASSGVLRLEAHELEGRPHGALQSVSSP
jgi:dTDP-glucose 4,6-dehydratase